MKCSKCNAEMVKHGKRRDTKGLFQMYKCQSCGHMMKGELLEESKHQPIFSSAQKKKGYSSRMVNGILETTMVKCPLCNGTFPLSDLREAERKSKIMEGKNNESPQSNAKENRSNKRLC